jgi:hypothetical protein
MSKPISERTTCAARALTPGIEIKRLTAVRKGRDVGLHLSIDSSDGGIKSIDLPEMKAEQKAMVFGNAAAQCLRQLRRGCF